MSKQQRGLGKGLGALLGGDADFSQIRKPVGYVNKQVVSQAEEPKDTSDILRIPVDMIEPNPYQPRMTFDQEALEELSESIKTLGLIQPITVRKKQDGIYQIISGERRFRASRLAGFTMIPAYIRDANDQGMLEMAIVENIQRENLDPIEVAMSYQRLIEECNLTQEQMAIRVGKKRASVTNFLRLLKLPAKIQHDLKVGLLSVGHAKVLLGMSDSAAIEKAALQIVTRGLSVRDTEKLVKTMEETATQKTEEKIVHDVDHTRALELLVQKQLGRTVKINESKKKRSITIGYSDNEDLDKLLTILCGESFLDNI